jgi:hypothetical protein
MCLALLLATGPAAQADDSPPIALPSFPSDPAPLIEAQRAAALAAVERFAGELRSDVAGQSWRDYLALDRLRSTLAGPVEQLDHTIIDLATVRLIAGRDGLEWSSLEPLRTALLRLQARLDTLAEDGAAEEYQSAMERLSMALQTPEDDVSQRDLQRGLTTLVASGIDQTLVSQLTARLSRPNVFATIDKRLLAYAIDRPVNDTSPFVETILGQRVRGTRHTVGNVAVEFVPSADLLQARLVFQGIACADTWTRQDRVLVTGKSTTQFVATKSLVVSADKVRVPRTTADAEIIARQTRVSVDGHLLKRIIQRVAERTVAERRPAAEAEAMRKAETRLREEMDRQGGERLGKLEDRLENNYRLPLTRLGAWPDPSETRLSTTHTRWTAASTYTVGPQVGATNDPPPVGQAAMAVRLHESALTNLAGSLAGRRFTDGDVQQALIDRFGELPEGYTPDPEPGSILFAWDDPLIVEFSGGKLRLIIRMAEFVRGERIFNDWSMLIEYGIEPKNGGLHFTRLEMQFYPNGKGPTDRLSLPEQFRANTLRKAFERSLPEDFSTDGIDLAEFLKKPGRLEVQRLSCDNGWLSMDWDMP